MAFASGVNEQLLFENWTHHAITEDSGTIALTAGQKYQICLEYNEVGIYANIHLLWKEPYSPLTQKKIIPKSQLYIQPIVDIGVSNISEEMEENPGLTVGLGSTIPVDILSYYPLALNEGTLILQTSEKLELWRDGENLGQQLSWDLAQGTPDLQRIIVKAVSTSQDLRDSSLTFSYADTDEVTLATDSMAVTVISVTFPNDPIRARLDSDVPVPCIITPLGGHYSNII